ncbi:GGDEF domain-containing protein [Catenuloplanes indicus]|uniref:Diguanylate cyclase (GGDEF)-like protein n=1 Tax=Catenuloplanes indicus TaxID=137267 RepID=A0AAE3VX88_9ACTN|nr:GGDEF domain-containing protein [Catenuloplanes indicus]MDQ0364972.1 diguanylate cyclase (GGDEF)-like protein [Catenuloplanes indicus]
MQNKSAYGLVATAAILASASIALWNHTVGIVVYLIGYLALCAVAWIAALRRESGTPRRPWVLVAVAATLWFAGDVANTVSYLYESGVWRYLGHLFWLSGYPVIAAALLGMARRRAAGRMRGAVLDALTLTMAAAAAIWRFIVEPLFDPAYSVLENVIPALYPLGDVVLLAATLIIALSPGARGVPTRLLLALPMLYLTVDLSLNVVPAWLPDFDVARIGTPLIMFGVALIVAARLHTGHAELTRPNPAVSALHPARVVFLGLALMTAPALTVLEGGVSRERLIALIATAVCAGFVLARFTIAVREQEHAQAQLAYQAHHDPLTGLANRTVLDDRLTGTLTGGPVALLYCDLDGFKEVNDTHGHEAGDAVLTAIAARLSETVRGTDLVARLGGDEFVLLCPGLDATAATQLAERVLDQVARPVPFRGTGLTVGVSIGIASYGHDLPDSAATVLRAADAAMYQAKHRGRRRWVLNDHIGAAGTPAAA